MNQLIPFNQSTAGNVHNFCLDNVRRGYGIDNKYGSAWEAWNHTEQHADRNIPDGLDVPLYYSYTADIDGVTQNYGHINVRLANGTVWSDGTIYPDVDAYLANHWPKYVGWGESVNDFKIIGGSQGDDMPITTDQLYEVIRGMTLREPTQGEVSNQDFINNPGLAIDTFWNNGGTQNYDAKLNDGDIINMKRGNTQLPDYQPSGGEFDYFKAPEHGWHDLAYDTMAGMQAQIDSRNTTINSLNQQIDDLKAQPAPILPTTPPQPGDIVPPAVGPNSPDSITVTKDNLWQKFVKFIIG